MRKTIAEAPALEGTVETLHHGPTAARVSGAVVEPIGESRLIVLDVFTAGDAPAHVATVEVPEGELLKLLPLVMDRVPAYLRPMLERITNG